MLCFFCFCCCVSFAFVSLSLAGAALSKAAMHQLDEHQALSAYVLQVLNELVLHNFGDVCEFWDSHGLETIVCWQRFVVARSAVIRLNPRLCRQHSDQACTFRQPVFLDVVPTLRPLLAATIPTCCSVSGVFQSAAHRRIRGCRLMLANIFLNRTVFRRPPCCLKTSV